MSINNWESFFDQHAPHYMNNDFTKNTLSEVDFVIEELRLAEGSRILDVGCGAGRHAVELAKRGFKVTGIDLSSGMLAEAKKLASAANVDIEWIHCDAVQYTPTETFDAAICLCEGAFGLVGRDEEPLEHDMAILKNISDALEPKGRFILTTLNAYSRIRSLAQEEVDSGRFNPLTMVENCIAEWDLPEGKRQVEVKERRYLPFELKQMFAQAGLKAENIWGGTLGSWNKRQSIDLDAIEIMIVSEKE
ncbi:cyclopropane-fatty-acyl-phospholipid synthase [Paenibacillus oryzae]|uniref:Cyclopropane-fatty-acyl-phospholipid synthase n=1 Tax=Paenibacillus oryzae TaxID=1844972 RepID=A0A1A5YF08_9BACL|nr:methyltransferase domain-containing protein [Paenibacillus oryzae]OBR64157.1 cyclopropane-fatty-acyl-phospholipid synthase [Paenibacillus oryzae]